MNGNFSYQKRKKMISDALNSSIVSLVTGYKIGAFNQNVTSNLPMRIAVLGEANLENQDDLVLTGQEVTTVKEAGILFGFGSPLYHVARILLPRVSGIPVVFYPQETNVEDATQKVLNVAISGTVTANATHTLRIAGRTNVDGQFYNFTVNVGDTISDIIGKIQDCVSNVLGSPVAVENDSPSAVFLTKWAGETANQLTIDVLTNGNDAGLTYAVTSPQDGAGVTDIATALENFGNEWNTLVVNCYGESGSYLGALEIFNGQPDATTPTGRYTATLFKPLLALFGTTSNDPTSVTDGRKTQCTNVACVAPNSKGWNFEAAANVCSLLAVQAQNKPHLDVALMSYPDMPIPADGNIGDMAIFDNRNAFVLKGCSTVDLVNGVYQICDLVTTYHPDGELNPLFRYVRQLIIDWNIYFNVNYIDKAFIQGNVILADSAFSGVDNVVKPKDVKQLFVNLFNDLESKALITDAAFSIESLLVGINETNPDRFDIQFKYKTSSFGRVVSTTAMAGFNLGSN